MTYSNVKHRFSSLSLLFFRLRYLIGFSLTLAFIMGIGYSAYQPTTPVTINEVSYSTGNVNLSLNPATLSLKPNTQQTLTLNIDAGSNKVSAVAVELNYDPDRLTINSVDQGDFLTNTLSAVTVANGTIQFTYASPPSSNGISGSGTLATIDITVKDKDTNLAFTTQTQVAVIGQTSNALHSATDTQITIDLNNGSPSPSPTSNPISSTPPTLRSAANPTCTNITLAWDMDSQAHGYYLDLASNQDFTNLMSSGKLSTSTVRYTFTQLNDNTRYYARITLADTPDFPHYSDIFEINTKDCSPANYHSAPTPQPTTTSTIPTTQTTSIVDNQPSTTQNISTSSLSNDNQLADSDPAPASTTDDFEGNLNDVFGTQPENNNQATLKPLTFWQKIILGWLAIIQKILHFF